MVCKADVCLFLVFSRIAPAVHSGGMHFVDIVSAFVCQCLSAAAVNNVRNVGARFSHSLTKSSQLKQVSIALFFLRRIEGALVLTRLVHSLLTLFATCCNMSGESMACFSTALQNDLYYFHARLFQ